MDLKKLEELLKNPPRPVIEHEGKEWNEIPTVDLKEILEYFKTLKKHAPPSMHKEYNKIITEAEEELKKREEFY